ncbi:MAG: hypothetical protein WKF75_09090 [Singulisphaera sp.]
MQESLAGQVDVSVPLGSYETIAAADVSYDKLGRWLYAAVVVVRAGTFEMVERSIGCRCRAGWPTSSSTRFDARTTSEVRSTGDPPKGRVVDSGLRSS